MAQKPTDGAGRAGPDKAREAASDEPPGTVRPGDTVPRPDALAGRKPAMRDGERPTRLREATRQARSFERVREAHQREVAEDYVELIADLIDVTGEARAVDLAERLGVTNATVNNALNRLARDGLVTRARYRSIFLTEAGRALADESRARHRIVRDALVKLGVDGETAEIDAEGIEHHISARTLEALRRFLDG